MKGFIHTEWQQIDSFPATVLWGSSLRTKDKTFWMWAIPYDLNDHVKTFKISPTRHDHIKKASIRAVQLWHLPGSNIIYSIFSYSSHSGKATPVCFSLGKVREGSRGHRETEKHREREWNAYLRKKKTWLDSTIITTTWHQKWDNGRFPELNWGGRRQLLARMMAWVHSLSKCYPFLQQERTWSAFLLYGAFICLLPSAKQEYWFCPLIFIIVFMWKCK